MVFLKISPTRGTIRFGRGELSPRYIGPFEVIERIGEVAYRLSLLANLDRVHNVFHVTQLHRYIADSSHVVDYSELKVGPSLTYLKQPVEIIDRREKQLRNQTIPIVRVMWRHHSPGESTWEREDKMRELYPSLFV